MIILWPASLCWDTQSLFPLKMKTFTRTTSSSYILSLMCTTSDQKVNTLLRGNLYSLLFFFYKFIYSVWFISLISPNSLAGGWRSFAALQSPPARPASWTAKIPTLTDSIGVVFPRITYGWHLPVSSCPVPQRHFAFLLYTSGKFIHVYMHTLCSLFLNALNGDTSAGLDCIRDCDFILQL